MRFELYVDTDKILALLTAHSPRLLFLRALPEMYHESNRDAMMLAVAFRNPSTVPEKEERM